MILDQDLSDLSTGLELAPSKETLTSQFPANFRNVRVKCLLLLATEFWNHLLSSIITAVASRYH